MFEVATFKITGNLIKSSGEVMGSTKVLFKLTYVCVRFLALRGGSSLSMDIPGSNAL